MGLVKKKMFQIISKGYSERFMLLKMYIGVRYNVIKINVKFIRRTCVFYILVNIMLSKKSKTMII